MPEVPELLDVPDAPPDEGILDDGEDEPDPEEDPIPEDEPEEEPEVPASPGAT